ncbi:MAG: SDR family NAD(P)-dependent oxidoreductase [Bacteroidia bacterium]|nr:SDR family NAD(P)-dependent oxidoreductase [Bacteroidia bacterium]
MKKTILITGSSDGIGKLAAIEMAKQGHEIILHGRSAKKLAAVVKEVKASGNQEEVRSYIADFSDLKEVKKMADAIQSEFQAIDVLVNNAGVFKSPVMQNKEGQDLRVVVNYFAPYLLSKELWPLLNAGESPRLINLSSAAQASVSNELLLGQKTVSMGESYAQSKLALTMWSFHLAKKQPDVSVIALNPGSLLDTRMVQEGYGYSWSPAEKGSKIIMELALDQEYQGITGKYYDNDQGAFGRAHSDAYNEVKVSSLIKLTEDILGK